MVGHVKREKRTNHSSILRPGSTGFTCGKWFIGYNFGTDDGAELKFSKHKELIVLNILKYQDCVEKPRDKSPGHFAKNRLVAGLRKEIEQ